MIPVNVGACKQDFYYWVNDSKQTGLIEGKTAYKVKQLFNRIIEKATNSQEAKTAFETEFGQGHGYLIKPVVVEAIKKAASAAFDKADTPIEPPSSTANAQINVNACANRFQDWTKQQLQDKRITYRNAEQLEKNFLTIIQNAKTAQEAKDTFSKAFLPMSRYFKREMVPVVRAAAFEAIDHASQPVKPPYFQQYLDQVNDACSICYEDFSKEHFTYEPTGAKAHKTACNHFFHKACLEEWKQQKGGDDKLSCPNCRQDTSFAADTAAWETELHTAHDEEEQKAKEVATVVEHTPVKSDNWKDDLKKHFHAWVDANKNKGLMSGGNAYNVKKAFNEIIENFTDIQTAKKAFEEAIESNKRFFMQSGAVEAIKKAACEALDKAPAPTIAEKKHVAQVAPPLTAAEEDTYATTKAEIVNFVQDMSNFFETKSTTGNQEYVKASQDCINATLLLFEQNLSVATIIEALSLVLQAGAKAEHINSEQKKLVLDYFSLVAKRGIA